MKLTGRIVGLFRKSKSKSISKVLAPPPVKERWSRKFRCEGCEYLIFAEEEDLRSAPTTWMGETLPVVLSICPNCGAHNAHDTLRSFLDRFPDCPEIPAVDSTEHIFGVAWVRALELIPLKVLLGK